MIPRYRDWLVRARDVLARLPHHEESVRRVRQEAFLKQVVAGELVEGEGTEPDWKRVAPELCWRFETFTRLVGGLGELERTVVDGVRRRETAATIWQLSIGDHEVAWATACAAVNEHLLYSLDGHPMGLFDVHGNVWEWCRNGYGHYVHRVPRVATRPCPDSPSTTWGCVPPGSSRARTRIAERSISTTETAA